MEYWTALGEAVDGGSTCFCQLIENAIKLTSNVTYI
jgi:hypothetical protein